MFNQLAKWTVIITLWNKFKKHLFFTLLLVAALSVTSMIHSDYLQYAAASQSNEIASSYFIKWGLNLLYVVIYTVVIVNLNEKVKPQKSQSQNRLIQPNM